MDFDPEGRPPIYCIRSAIDAPEIAFRPWFLLPSAVILTPRPGMWP